MDESQTKVVYKPWGREVWLELNDKYCYKRLYINAGHRTSYQYHNYKLETNYIISGKANVWLENDKGVVEKRIMSAGDWFTVHPTRKHRIIAITDLVLQETSTPEVDDVVRLEDDSNRCDGRIDHEHVKNALCIMAAGVGQRLNPITQYISKGLLPINNKAVISHIIDRAPQECDIVVAIGHKGHLVKEYCLAAHPNRNLIFVTVDKYEGEGTGPGYSLYQCKQYLQRPFYVATADCIVDNDLPLIDHNWLGVSRTIHRDLYSTAEVNLDNDIVSFCNKSPDGYPFAFIGLAAIKDYDVFWSQLETNLDEGELVAAFYNTHAYSTLKAEKFDWYDTGTIENYEVARQHFETDRFGIAKSTGECVYKIDNQFIKLSPDGPSMKNRMLRANHLLNFIPKLTYQGEHVYAYQWIEGHTLYGCDQIAVWDEFLDWCLDNLWARSNADITELCLKFYRDKTQSRIADFFAKKGDEFVELNVINGHECKPIESYDIDWEKLANNGIATSSYHGDLQFDNIIHGDGGFYLIDWRQSFANSTDYGDVYYDLAKLYGGIMMSYQLMKDDKNIRFSAISDSVEYGYDHPEMLELFKPRFEKWVHMHGYDLDHIKLLTALIYLNMAPLHLEPFDELLFYHSKLLLNELNVDD